MNNIIDYTKTSRKRKNTGGDRMCKILEKIKDKTALELLREYNIEITPPIDISSLLDNIGISVIAKDFTDIERKCGYTWGKYEKIIRS